MNGKLFQGIIQKKYGRIVFFAARGMEGVVIPPGGPRRCLGGNEAPIFFFFLYKTHSNGDL